jgi:hypothetical protein
MERDESRDEAGHEQTVHSEHEHPGEERERVEGYADPVPRQHEERESEGHAVEREQYAPEREQYASERESLGEHEGHREEYRREWPGGGAEDRLEREHHAGTQAGGAEDRLEREHHTAAQAGEQRSTAMMDSQEMDSYRRRWQEIQASFVDEPRQAVQQADRLVDDVIQHFTRFFSQERARLEQQWSRGDELSTEDLRVALQQYRTFFHGLLR